MELLRDAAPRVLERHAGQLEWLAADRLSARFNGAARAVGGAVELGETAASLGLAIRQGIHVGEIDVSQLPLSGLALDVAAAIARSAGPGEILLSRVAGELVTGTGFEFAPREAASIDGVAGPLALLAVTTARHLEPALRKPPASDLARLTPRETEILALVADGSSNARIAVLLGLSEHTVKRHVANILLKLDLPSRAAAAGALAGQGAV